MAEALFRKIPKEITVFKLADREEMNIFYKEKKVYGVKWSGNTMEIKEIKNTEKGKWIKIN